MTMRVKILRPVNIWLSYMQESLLSRALCVPGHSPAKDEEVERYLEYSCC